MSDFKNSSVLNGNSKAVLSRKGQGSGPQTEMQDRRSPKGQSVPHQRANGRNPLDKQLPPSRDSRGVAATDNDGQDGPPIGPFPVDALPPVARDLVLQVAAAGRVSAAMPAAAVLGVAVAAIGRGLFVRNDMGLLSGNLFMAIVAKSGSGKKLVFDRCMAPFIALSHELVDDWQRKTLPRLRFRVKAAQRDLEKAEKALREVTGTPEETDAEERAVAAANEVEKINREILRCPKLVLTNPNLLALARTMQGQEGESCSVMSSEAVSGLAGLLGAGMGNGQGSEGFICACYSGDVYSDDRLSRAGITLRNPCLTLVSFIQPDVMTDMLTNQKLVDRGLMARFLMVREDNNRVMPDQVAEAGDLDDPWHDLVRDLTLEYRMNHGKREPAIIKTSPGVEEIFRAYRDEVEKDIVPGGKHTDIESFVRRRPEQAARIALVLHALLHGAKAHEHPLSRATARNAVRVARWFAAQQVEILGVHRISRHRARADKLRKALLQHPGQTASLGKLSKAHGFNENEVHALCADFPKLFRLQPKSPGATRGRPTEHVTAI